MTRYHSPYRWSLNLLAPLFTLLFSACSPWVGNSIEVRELPPLVDVPENLRGSGKVISVAEFEDTRVLPVGDGPATPYSEATGEVSRILSDSLKAELQKRGFAIAPNAPLQIKAQILKWRTKVEAKASTRVESEASLNLTVVDRANRIRYTGSYNGLRESEGPVVSKNDIRSSLGAAAANTLSQVVKDEKLMRVLTAE